MPGRLGFLYTILMSRALPNLVCYCYNVTEPKIRSIIKKHDLEAVGDVTWYTGAGGGCGGCRHQIEELIVSHQTKDAKALDTPSNS